MAQIVETEAYLSKDDLSCHASVGKTKRNAPMFENGGILYVYKIYGIHHCINFVTEKAGKGSAVLIRAAEPLLGIVKMYENRGWDKKKGTGRREKGVKNVDIFNLCKGPGNLAKALGFTIDDNFKSLNSPDLFIQKVNLPKEIKIGVSKRIGITKSSELQLRFFIKGNPCVSR